MPETNFFCVTCHYWQLDTDSTVGTCHRRAPTRNLDLSAAWPITGPLMSCGEHEPAGPDILMERKACLQREG